MYKQIWLIFKVFPAELSHQYFITKFQSICNSVLRNIYTKIGQISNESLSNRAWRVEATKNYRKNKNYYSHYILSEIFIKVKQMNDLHINRVNLFCSPDSKSSWCLLKWIKSIWLKSFLPIRFEQILCILQHDKVEFRAF